MYGRFNEQLVGMGMERTVGGLILGTDPTFSCEDWGIPLQPYNHTMAGAYELECIN
jgi:hypothetical protein